MKMLSVLLIVLVLLGLCCLPAAAAAPARLRAGFTTETIPIDGTDGGPWASAETSGIGNAKRATHRRRWRRTPAYLRSSVKWNG